MANDDIQFISQLSTNCKEILQALLPSHVVNTQNILLKHCTLQKLFYLKQPLGMTSIFVFSSVLK